MCSCEGLSNLNAFQCTCTILLQHRTHLPLSSNIYPWPVSEVYIVFWRTQPGNSRMSTRVWLHFATHGPPDAQERVNVIVLHWGWSSLLPLLTLLIMITACHVLSTPTTKLSLADHHQMHSHGLNGVRWQMNASFCKRRRITITQRTNSRVPWMGY